MNWDKFRAKVSNEINSYASEVNTTEIWHGIESAVTADNRAYHEKKRRRYFLLILLFLGVSGALSVGLYGLWSPEKDLLVDKTLDQSIYLGEVAVESADIPGASRYSDITSQEETPEAGNQQQAEKIVSTDKSTAQTERLNAERIPEYTEPKGITAFNNSEKKDKKIVAFKTDNTAGTTREKNKAHKDKDDDPRESLGTPISDMDLKTVNRMESILPINTLPFKIQASDSHEKRRPSAIHQETIPMVTVSKKAFSARLDILGGMSSVQRSLTSITPESAYWAEVREMTELPLSSIHYGAQFTMQHKSNFALTIGYSQNTIHERFMFDEMSIDTSYDQGIQAAYVDIEEDTVALLGPVPTFRTTTTAYSVVNRIQLHEIPILLGYFKNTKGWSYGVQSGIYVNTSLVATGKIIESEGAVIALEEDASEIYRSDVGLSYYAGLSISKEIIGNVHVGLSGYMRYFPENFSATSTELNQSYRLLGGQMSIGYSF